MVKEEFIIETENSLINSEDANLSPNDLQDTTSDAIFVDDIVTDVQDDDVVDLVDATSLSVSTPSYSEDQAQLASDPVEKNDEDSGNNIDVPKETTEHNIDDVYTLLSNGLSVNVQSESETESIQNQSESEISLSDLKTSIDNLYILESEFYQIESEQVQVINNNLVNASNNNSAHLLVCSSLLASVLGGLVAIGFLKGLR